MESGTRILEQESPSQHWRSCKLVIDPALTKGLYKVHRFDGERFSLPVDGLGLCPVGDVGDPRICRLWSRSHKVDLLRPKFKVDEYYVGPIPPKEVTFAKLNDNVKEAFLTSMCEKYGQVEEVEVFYNPKSKKHLGIAKVVFETVKAAKDAVEGLNQTSVMGNIIHVEIDTKGENRVRYVQLLVHGLYTPWTLPVGSSEQGLQSLIDSLLQSVQRRESLSSPSSVSTPLSQDTGYSSVWLDTPCSFGVTPHPFGTPRTPCLPPTPLSQDSCYSSLQATPILQGEPSVSAHKPARLELLRKFAHFNPGLRETALFRRWPSLSQLKLLAQREKRSAHCNDAATGKRLNYNSLSIFCESATDDRATATEDYSSMMSSPPPAGYSLPLEQESLDSRIESLLTNNHFFDDKPEADAFCESPGSPFNAHDSADKASLDKWEVLNNLSVKSLTESEEDETAQAVSFLTKTSLSPFPCDSGLNRNVSSAPLPTKEPSSPSAPRPGSFPRSPASNNPAPPFPPPFFHPSLPPIPLRLPNGMIPIPPPGWVPPPCHTGIPLITPPALPTLPPTVPPPRHAPPPPAFLRTSPRLMLPPPVPLPLPINPGTLAKLPPMRPIIGAAAFCRPWPPLFPKFNPLVPPPDFPLPKENLHKITVEKVLEVIVNELKTIIKKDITRRMIEGCAFKAFEDWWICQEERAKISPTKSVQSSSEDRSKLSNPLSNIIGRVKKPPLPSFKVKRKSEASTTEDCRNVAEISDQDGGDTAQCKSPKIRRRHGRPHVLDSDEDEEVQNLNDGSDDQDKDGAEGTPSVSDEEVMFDEVDEKAKKVCEELEKVNKIENVIDLISETSEEVISSDQDTFSETSASEESESCSDFDSSDSESDLSPGDMEEEEEDEEGEEEEEEECIVISSDEEEDEESVGLDTALTPQTPQTPGAELDLDLDLPGWLEPFQRAGVLDVDHEDAPGPQQTSEEAVMMDLQMARSLGAQVPFPEPIAEEPNVDMELENREWIGDAPENTRPPTPSGCLAIGDPDILSSKSTSPFLEEVGRPRTPGRGMLSGSDESDAGGDIHLSPFGSSSHASPELRESHPDVPGVPDDRRTPLVAPPTPGWDRVDNSPPITSPHQISSHAFMTTPKTPGRDIIFPRRSIVHRRKTQTNDSLLIDGSFSSSTSEYSSDSLGDSGVCNRHKVRSRPLQGLENVPGLFDVNRREAKRSLIRRKELKKRKWRIQRWQKSLRRFAGLVPVGGRTHRSRSRCEERRILHSVWRDGLDDEDMTLLKCTYERLQGQDSGLGWLSETLWIPHPPSKMIRSRSGDFECPWIHHRTGSARSEGFYKISRKEKMKYLNLKPASPSTNVQQRVHVQLPTLLRATSDFRLDQRRLLSTFSADSDLVKFNLLKFRKKRIRFRRSHIHEWGLFAMEPIAADEMVIEYVGEIIRQVIADMREQRYEGEGIGSSYLFRVDYDTIIDATKCGNLARFINHSCNPNCYAKIITVDSEKKIVIYSRQQININEEITYDYKFPIEETKIPCLCGADSCRGSLN